MDAALAAVSLLLISQASPDSERRGAANLRLPPVSVRAGESAVLGCDLGVARSGRAPPYVIEWYKQGVPFPLLIQFGSYPARVDPAYTGRASLVQAASLHMRDIQAEDSGWYECRVLFLDRDYDPSANGTWAYLSVTAPPRFRHTPAPYVEARQGANVALYCSAVGEPEPRVAWKKNGDPLQASLRYQLENGRLVIVGAQRNDSGIYACWASSVHGEVVHVTRLLVQGPPVIVLPPRNVTVNASQHALFSCRAEAYPSNISYSWFYGGTNVHSLRTLEGRVRVLLDGSLLLYRTGPDDAGTYRCLATNGLGRPATATAKLTVLFPARVVAMPAVSYLPVGLPGSLVCPTRAIPPVSRVNWMRGGQPLDLSQMDGWVQELDGTITIPRPTKAAEGIYTCTPFNKLGTSGPSPPTQVLLKPPPYFTIKPDFEYYEEAGRLLTIPCSAEGSPTPRIHWKNVDGEVSAGQQVLRDGRLQFRSLSRAATGCWVCEASNAITTIRAETHIFVTGTAPQVSYNLNVSVAVHSVNLSWEPGYNGGHLQNFSVWSKRAVGRPAEWASWTVPVGQTELTLGGLAADTLYQFSILATNLVGSSPFSTMVTARTLHLFPPVPMPTNHAVTGLGSLLPPRCLVANQTERAVYLVWLPPVNETRVSWNYSVEVRRRGQQWEQIDSLPSSQTTSVIEGLAKGSWYDIRVRTVSKDSISEPSNMLTIWTTVSREDDGRSAVAAPVLAAVVAALSFLAIAVLFSTATACLVNRRNNRPRSVSQLSITHCKKRTESESSLGTESREEADQPQPLELRPGRSHARQQASARRPGPPSPIELIARGPDGRFLLGVEEGDRAQVTTEQQRVGGGRGRGRGVASEASRKLAEAVRARPSPRRVGSHPPPRPRPPVAPRQATEHSRVKNQSLKLSERAEMKMQLKKSGLLSTRKQQERESRAKVESSLDQSSSEKPPIPVVQVESQGPPHVPPWDPLRLSLSSVEGSPDSVAPPRPPPPGTTSPRSLFVYSLSPSLSSAGAAAGLSPVVSPAHSPSPSYNRCVLGQGRGEPGCWGENNSGNVGDCGKSGGGNGCGEQTAMEPSLEGYGSRSSCWPHPWKGQHWGNEGLVSDWREQETWSNNCQECNNDGLGPWQPNVSSGDVAVCMTVPPDYEELFDMRATKVPTGNRQHMTERHATTAFRPPTGPFTGFSDVHRSQEDTVAMVAGPPGEHGPHYPPPPPYRPPMAAPRGPGRWHALAAQPRTPPNNQPRSPGSRKHRPLPTGTS
uniref:protein turtle homolog B-like isoform X2 n=1 Tax=Myxine glutinosa TaxID=7769 RepID=UPI00358FA2F1